MTRYSYDDDGRLAAAVTTVETEWDADARGMALALTEYEAGLCPSCRHPLAETAAAGNEFRYVADLPVRCHRCTASDQLSKVYQDSPSPSALLIPIRLREEVGHG